MIPLNLREYIAGYKLSKSQEKFNHLMSKNEKELETLIQTVNTVKIYGLEFDRDKCAMLVMKSDKRHITEGIELPNQEKLRTFGEKETYKYLEILEDSKTT